MAVNTNFSEHIVSSLFREGALHDHMLGMFIKCKVAQNTEMCTLGQKASK